MKAFLYLWVSLAMGQDLPPVSAATDYAHPHEGVSPPKLVHSYDPDFTPQALEAGISGTLVLQVVIDKEGKVAYASVLSPLPAGLDVKALAAMRRWRYAPAVMDAEIIPVLTTIDVLFRPPYKPDDPVEEEEQQEYRRLKSLASPNSTDVEGLKHLVIRNYRGALELFAEWQIAGKGVAKDVPAGITALQKAASRNDARALFLVGHSELTGEMLPKNEPDGWRLMKRAAFFGNAEAQTSLGENSEQFKKLNDAKWYFRLCAASAHPVCEYNLGKLLVTGPGINPNDFSQGIAWLELAKDHGNVPAAKLWQTAASELSSLQVDWVAQLKPHLELKNFRGF